MPFLLGCVQKHIIYYCWCNPGPQCNCFCLWFYWKVSIVLCYIFLVVVAAAHGICFSNFHVSCIFIYSGKTYTMVGTSKDPGLMVLSLNTIFDLIKRDKSSDAFEVSCSYLEVYNEVKFWICPCRTQKVQFTCLF